ncbi:hypothetical protein [Cellulomonas sp. ICMP 17802]|uniref:hypothetical protein n=1 Tax=Cellulomonas sp. ICMP 17802 TaxID=3239199 RepID=UPI00351B48F0
MGGLERLDGPGGRGSVAAPSRAAGWSVAATAAVLALAVRWSMVGGRVGLYGYQGYDDGVYFASAVAFVHGQMPYRDFLLLHPPGIMLALAPFAALARRTGDATALAAARAAFIGLGALSTVLVTRIARRWGTAPMVAAALLYALSPAAAYADRITLLEPLGTVTLLGAVVLLVRASDTGAPGWCTWVGGAVLGLGPAVKIWNVVPVLVVVAWQAHVRGVRTALVVGSAAAASTTLVLLPFAVTAPARMLRLVVLDQLGRARTPASTATRLTGIAGLDVTSAPTTGPGGAALLVLVCGLVVACAAVAWHGRRGRLWVVLLAGEVAVLLLSPSYFAHYAAFSAAALALVVAAAVPVVPAPARVATAAALCLALGALAVAVQAPAPVPFPAAEIRRHLPATGCIRSDSPGALALLGVLSRDVARGCPVPVDLSGQTYDVGSRDRHGKAVPRILNQRWQRDVTQYLTSGAATVLARGVGDGFDAGTTRALGRLTTVVDRHGIRLLLPRPDRSP